MGGSGGLICGRHRSAAAVAASMMLGAAIIACALLSGCSSGNTQGAGLARPTLELATQSLTVGYPGELAVDSHDASGCVLFFAGPRRLSDGPFRVSLGRPHVDWRWRVPADAARGTWKAQVTCARGAGRSPALVQPLVVKPPAAAASHMRAAASMLVLAAAVEPGSGIVAPGSLRVSTAVTSPAGQASPTGGQVSTTGAGNPHFEVGQCTWWADLKRPDIFQAAVAHGVPAGGPSSPWDAWKWAQNARVGGLQTGSAPQAGAVAVFPQGSWRSSVGHVAYVESVSQDSYVISEENFGAGEYVGVHPDGDDPDPRLRRIYTRGHAGDWNVNPTGTEFIYRTHTAGGVPPSIDWYNTGYTSTCGGIISPSFDIQVHNGKGTTPASSQSGYQYYEVEVQAVKHGDLTGNGRADTAVLLYCAPQASNFFLQEVQVFGPDNRLLAELVDVATLTPAGSPLPPEYVPSEFSISGGELLTGMKFYAPTDSHAGGPSISLAVIWHWNGHQFTHSPISVP